MQTKTPKFDEALEKIYENLSPQKRTCETCGNSFDISAEDISYLKKLRVPPLNECPECRARRRMAMLANIFQFYKKECSAHSGESLISQLDAKSQYKIYDNKYWWDVNAWDATGFGRVYDANESFYEQLNKLLHDVPHMAISRYNKNIINSDYSVESMDVKNCYVSSVIGVSEDVSYGLWAAYAKDCVDVLRVDHLEHCYDILDSDRIYESQYIQNCKSCINSKFLFDCHDCHDCFMCANLRSKQYCFLNKQFSKEEYMQKISEIDLGRRSVAEEYKRKFSEMIEKDSIHRDLIIRNSPGSLGSHISDSKNCVDVYNASGMKYLITFYRNENVRHSSDIIGTHDCMDVTIFGPGELCYNVAEGLFSNLAIASYFVSNCRQVEYCFECSDCKYCFGCSGLKKKNFCVLNKQYSPEEYWKLVDKIKVKMLSDGNYGEFLRLEDSFFYYHDTYGYAMMPVSKEKAGKLGARLRDYEVSMDVKGMKVISGKDLTDDIKDATDDILNMAIICQESGRPFRIIKSELDFYRRNSIPLPAKSPRARLMKRFHKRSPYKIWKRICSKCGKEILTTYDPSKNLKIYCEPCYRKEVY